MSRVALIGTFYDRPDDAPAIAAAIRAQTRQPDELWLMHERPEDGAYLRREDWGNAARFASVAIERDADGSPLVTPFAPLINHALEHSGADLFLYLTDDSLPDPEKIERMAAALDDHPTWGAVYCWQANTVRGELNTVNMGLGTHPVRYGDLDHTAVMHRRTADRWPEDLEAFHDADRQFFWAVARRLGPIRAVPLILDTSDRRVDGLNVALLRAGRWALG